MSEFWLKLWCASISGAIQYGDPISLFGGSLIY